MVIITIKKSFFLEVIFSMNMLFKPFISVIIKPHKDNDSNSNRKTLGGINNMNDFLEHILHSTTVSLNIKSNSLH